MKSHNPARTVVACLCLLSLMTLGGCIIYTDGQGHWSGGWDQKRYERTVDEQAPRGTITSLDVDSTFGSITITGADVNEFAVTAQIVGHAPTEEEAQELAEQTQIKLEPTANTLRIRADVPETRANRSVSVSYTIMAPKPMNLKCGSRYGAIRITGTEGAVDARTSNGAIDVERLRGDVNLHTSYGAVTCVDAVGQTVSLRSSNGSITARQIEGSTSIESSYGAITCESFSGPDLRIKTSNGKIAVSHAKCDKCDLDTSYGAIACSALTSDSLRLHSNNGSVDVANAQAESVDLSTSYGAIKAHQITAPDIVAHSGNGSINITCSDSCPHDLKADVRSSYGSIDFTAPPQFAGQVRLSTHYGSVRTALPVTMSGEINKKNITGQIGDGAGSIRLETNNGSIDLK